MRPESWVDILLSRLNLITTPRKVETLSNKSTPKRWYVKDSDYFTLLVYIRHQWFPQRPQLNGPKCRVKMVYDRHSETRSKNRRYGVQRVDNLLLLLLLLLKQPLPISYSGFQQHFWLNQLWTCTVHESCDRPYVITNRVIYK